MSRDYSYDSELDAILAEFSSHAEKYGAVSEYSPLPEEIPEPEPPKRPVPPQEQTRHSAPTVEPTEGPRAHAQSQQPSPSIEEKRVSSVQRSHKAAEKTTEPAVNPEPARRRTVTERKPPVQPVVSYPQPRSEEPEEEAESFDVALPPVKKPSLGNRIAMSFAALIFLCVSCLALGWVVLNVHPDSGTATMVSGDTKLKLVDKLDIYMNNLASDALGELAYIRKIYAIEESATVAPKPPEENFGVTDDPAVIQAVIDEAWELLEGQEVIWNPDLDFVPGEPMRYYYDETILVIQWKEYIDQRCCTCAEVKVANGSQIRRKLSEDTYGSSVQLYASQMAEAVNSVIAINGDYYTFRDLGITVYQRKLYRNNPAKVDSCFITADGDMLFSRAGELMGAGEAEKFIEDNDVVFGIAFGPILVDNGQLQQCESYPIGEINTPYSRSSISLKSERHYFLMTINHTDDARPRATINELAKYVHSKGVEKAYTLDGGQTSEIVMLGGPVNKVDFGHERTVSDIIYFATAIPEQEVTG